MLSIIYPHRNRNIKRIERSLRSLQEQSTQDFEVYFVDYGSDKKLALEIEGLLKGYSFVNYVHYPTYHQPWNKCRALNSVIKHLETDFCFVADIDMIFHQDFVKTASSLQEQKTAVYFQVGFLNALETKKDKSFQEYEIDFRSTNEATGLTMFPVKALQSIKGFDEFYHFWGAEDTDAHVRLKNAGFEVDFYDKKILMLHQWHSSYRSKESKKLTKELRLSNAVKLNHQHLKYTVLSNATLVNETGWGNPLTRESYEELIGYTSEEKILSTKKEIIDHFLFHDLAMINHEIRSFIIKPHTKPKSIKDYLKKMLGKSQAHFYSLKEVNDLILMQIVTTYRNYDYTLEADITRNEIGLKIRKSKLHA